MVGATFNVNIQYREYAKSKRDLLESLFHNLKNVEKKSFTFFFI